MVCGWIIQFWKCSTVHDTFELTVSYRRMNYPLLKLLAFWHHTSYFPVQALKLIICTSTFRFHLNMHHFPQYSPHHHLSSHPPPHNHPTYTVPSSPPKQTPTAFNFSIRSFRRPRTHSASLGLCRSPDEAPYNDHRFVGNGLVRQNVNSITIPFWFPRQNRVHGVGSDDIFG